jgi:hypothetical protein
MQAAKRQRNTQQQSLPLLPPPPPQEISQEVWVMIAKLLPTKDVNALRWTNKLIGGYVLDVYYQRLPSMPSEVLIKIAELLPAEDLIVQRRTNSLFEDVYTRQLAKATARMPELKTRDQLIEAMINCIETNDQFMMLLLNRMPAMKDYFISHFDSLYVSIKNSPNNGVIRILMAAYKLEKSRFSGKTMMHMAAEKGDVEMVNRLIHRGVPVDIQDSNGHTALFEAVIFNKARVLEILLECGANPNVVRPGYARSDLTPLHLIEYDNHKLVKMLVKHGAKIDATDDYGSTPLSTVIRKNKNLLDAVHAFLENGADINTPALNGETPLHVAMTIGSCSLWVLIGSRPDADFSRKDRRGTMPLDNAYRTIRWSTPATGKVLQSVLDEFRFNERSRR